MTGPSLRPTRPDEIATLRAMETGPDTVPWLGDSSPGWHARGCADPGVEHLTALRDGDIVGFVVLAAPRGTETGTELRRIVVAPGLRGQGLGRAVLRAAVDRAAAGGARRIWLDVRPGNERALALYRAEGFADERALPSDPRDPDSEAALLVLARTL